MANQLILLKKDFFTDEQQAVTVADRYPQDVFAEHTHEFCELVMVWRGNGLHVLNERPYRITRGDLFYIRAEDKHSYTSVNDLVLQKYHLLPGAFETQCKLAGDDSRLSGSAVASSLAAGQYGNESGAAGH